VIGEAGSFKGGRTAHVRPLVHKSKWPRVDLQLNVAMMHAESIDYLISAPDARVSAHLWPPCDCDVHCVVDPGYRVRVAANRVRLS